MSTTINHKVDVALCTFNDARTLPRTVSSVLIQECLNILYIVDDGSTDNTSDILEPYLGDDRIKVLTNKRNHGLAFSLNRILRISSSKYVARIDADDEMLPGRLITQLSYLLENDNVSVLGTNAYYIDNKNKCITNVILSYEKICTALKFKNPMLHPTIMIDRSSILNIGGYDESLLRGQDFDLWIRAMRSGLKIRNLAYCSVNINKREGRSLKSIITEFKVNLILSFRHFLPLIAIFSFLGLTKNLLSRR